MVRAAADCRERRHRPFRRRPCARGFRYGCKLTLAVGLKLLPRRPEQDFVYVHVFRLADRESHGARERVSRNRDFLSHAFLLNLSRYCSNCADLSGQSEFAARFARRGPGTRFSAITQIPADAAGIFAVDKDAVCNGNKSDCFKGSEPQLLRRENAAATLQAH
jgi:hypothetical protein